MTPQDQKAADYDQRMDARIERRVDREDIAFERRMKLEDRACELIGELVRNGEKVHYITTVARKVKEGHKRDLINFLIRNGYV